MQPSFFDSDDGTFFRQDGQPIAATAALRGVKYVLVYFAASWCTPSRACTHRLMSFYERHHVTENFTVIFVSRDDSEKEMLQHFARDHGDYYRLGFAEAKGLTAEWGKLYKLHSIPNLLVFENAMPRKLLVRDARRIRVNDPDARFFPWATYENPQARAHL